MSGNLPIDPLALRWPLAIAVFIGSFLLTAATLKDYGVTWDEPPYFHASDLHVQWLSDLARSTVHGEIKKAFSDEGIDAAWHWDPYHVPHPPFSRVVSGLTKAIAAPFVDKLTAYRLGPALFFALLATVIFLWTSELFGRPTGVFSALAVASIPNFFGFAHIAVTDLPLACMWFVTVYCFWKGLKSWQWSVTLSVAWGLALATKFPAVLIPIPLILWAHVYKRESYANNVFAMFFVSPLVMLVAQPYLWHQPGMRLLEFLFSGISRGYRPDANFPVYWFGHLYLTNQLPWYYPFWVIGVTTPEPILALALVGVAVIPFCRQRAALMLLVMNALFIPLMGLAPGAVLHDGMRQLLSALPFLAALAAAGFHKTLEALMIGAEKLPSLQKASRLKLKVLSAGVFLALFPAVLDIFLYHPYELSYYNHMIGGARGAYDKGLEVTYFMEAFTPDFLLYLDRKLPPNAVVNASFANFMFQYYQKENRLRGDLRFIQSDNADYYVLLTRRSVWSKNDWRLFNTDSPVAAVRLGDVPLVSVYRLRAALPRK
jgi:dolichyl-phosphate-mannose-protein mannosyltransferase